MKKNKCLLKIGTQYEVMILFKDRIIQDPQACVLDLEERQKTLQENGETQKYIRTWKIEF